MAISMKTIGQHLEQLMLIPGLSGHECRVASYIRDTLEPLGLTPHTDKTGNVMTTIEGDPNCPSIMLFTHMDQLGFIVRKIENDGLIRVERVGGVPERALAAQAVLLCVEPGRDVPGIIINKSHHATSIDEKYTVLKTAELLIDTGHGSKQGVRDSGIHIGTPVIYMPRFMPLANQRIAGTAIDDRAGCAVQLTVAEHLTTHKARPTIHLVWSVLEEFNLRGAVIAAQQLKPDMALQIDLMLACDTPDLAERGEMVLGGGPGISLYSFHGRGTLNGVIPHPRLVRMAEEAAKNHNIPLQYSAQSGVLTDLSYVQQVGSGVAALDIGFPMRYSHSSLESCDLHDLEQLAKLICGCLETITPEFDLNWGR